MRLRHRADVRTVVWAFVLMPAVVIAQYRWASLAGWLLPFAMYTAYSAAVIAHNHNHVPTFLGKRMNAFFSSWISIFYGFPTYGWIPTHNENHHRYVGRKGDATVVVVPGRPDDAWTALTHFFRSTRTQGPLLARYRRKVCARSRRAWLAIWLQYVVVYGTHLAMLALALRLHGVGRGLFVYLSALGIPAFMALWGIQWTNWIQHVGCLPGSTYDHSRNFVSPWMNYLVFDNGYHTVHHARAGLHWSHARAAHEKIAEHIDPRLNCESVFHYAFDAYVLHRPTCVLTPPPASTDYAEAGAA
ncbi:MAG: fatty acid desaturase [Labilithrix sp.]